MNTVFNGNDIYHLLKFDQNKLEELLKTNKNEVFDKIDEFMENNTNKKQDFIVFCLYSNIKILIDYVFSKLNEEEYAQVCAQFISNPKNIKNTYYLDIIDDQMKKNEIESLPMVENLAFSWDLPVDMFTAFIKGFEFEDLYNYFANSNFTSNFFNNKYDKQEKTDIVSIILEKTYKSDNKIKFKNKIIKYITSNEEYVDEKIKDLIFFTNPTNFTFDSIYLNFPKSLEKLSDKDFHLLIRTLSPLKSFELNKLLRIIDTRDISLLEDALNLYKSKNVRPDDRVFKELINFLKSKNNDESIKKIIKKFFIETGSIPVSYTIEVDKECMKKASFKDLDKNFFKDFNEKSILYLTSLDGEVIEEVFSILKRKVDNNEKVSGILFTKFAKDFISEENIAKILMKENITFSGFNKYLLYSDDTFKYICSNMEYKDFVIKKVLPHINLDVINNFTDGFLESLYQNYLSEIIDILYKELGNNKKLKFPFLQTLNFVSSNDKVLEFLNYIFDNDYIDFNEAFSRVTIDTILLVDNSLTDKIMGRLIDEYEEYIFSIVNITALLEKKGGKLEGRLARLIDETTSFESVDFDDLLPFFPDHHKTYLNSIINAIKDKRLVIPNDIEMNISFLNSDLMKTIYNNNNQMLDEYIAYISNNYYEIRESLTEKFDKDFIDLYSDYYNIDKEVLLYIYKTYGNTFFPLLSTDDFLYLVDNSIEKISKLFDLVMVRKMDVPTIEAINWSIREGIFSKENRDIISIYPIIISEIQNNISDSSKQKYINLLKDHIPKDIKNKILETGNDLLYKVYLNKNYYLFLDYLFDLIKANQELYSDLLNSITTNFIISKRNEYGNKGNIYKDTNITFSFNEKSLQDYLFNGLTKKDPDLLLEIIYVDEKTSIKDKSMIDYLNSNDENDKDKLREFGKYIGNMKKRFYTFYSGSKTSKRGRETFKKIMSNFDEAEILNNVKKDLILDERRQSLDEVFGRVNIKNLLDIVSDDELYNSLLDVMKKYKLLDWFNIFDKQMDKLIFASSKEKLGTFLDSFKNLYAEEKNYIEKYVKPVVLSDVIAMQEKGASQREIDDYKQKKLTIKFTPLKILRLITEYSNIPVCYKILLGEEDFNLIRTDPEPNSASTKKGYDKFERCVDVELKAFKERFVTIPSFVEYIILENGKKIKVVVGNRTHPMNLTQGERTGSCMRACGDADRKKENDLFEYCASNVNGFHVILLDENDNYITRSSGFKVGNTVILNQIRKSTDENISNDEVVETFKKTSKLISERSGYTIENVVSSARIALKDYPLQKISDEPYGMSVYKGYRDISNKVVVLYTRGGEKLIPLNEFAPSEKYECTRLKPKIFVYNINDREKILMQRITAIKRCLENESDKKFYKNIDFDLKIFNTNYKYLVLGDDFYVAVDFDNNITYDYIEIDKRYKTEFDEAIRSAKNFIGEKYARKI